jgi:hypothetical protein
MDSFLIHTTPDAVARLIRKISFKGVHLFTTPLILLRLWGLLRPHGALCSVLGRDNYRVLLAEAIKQVIRSGMSLPGNFTNDDLVAVYWYTHQNLKSLNYKSLNAVLWSVPRKEKKELLELSAHLTIALEKLPPFEGRCWRTAKFDVTAQLAHAEGTTVQYPAFTSTSKSLRKRPINGGSYILLTSKTGRYVGGISRFPGEAEVLFMPGAIFNVLTNNQNGGTRELEMEEV